MRKVINNKIYMKKILFIFLITLVPSFAFADVSIMLDVEAPSGTLYSNTLTVTPCPVTNDPATTTISAKCALEQAGLNPQWSNYGGDDWFLTAAGGASQDSSNNLYIADRTGIPWQAEYDRIIAIRQ